MKQGREDAVPAFVGSRLPLMVVVAKTRWDEPPRMRHGLTKQFLRFFNVLFIEFFPTSSGTYGRLEFECINDRLVVWRPQPKTVPVRLYANDPTTHSIVNYLYKRQIEQVVSKQPSRPVLLANFTHDFPQIMKSPLFAHSMYICFDELPKMRRRARKRNPVKVWYQSNLNQHYENMVARRASRCFTCHYPLRKKLLKVNNNVEMLFHGHDYPSIAVSEPDRSRDIINVGFGGYINWRLIEDWLLAVVEQKDMVLHLIGTSENYDVSRFKDYPNVRHVSSLSDTAFREKLLQMDVLIMPYNVELPEVEVMTTNSKTFQYIAACKPIVISNMPNYIEMPYGVIYKADTRSHFIDQIRKAYTKDCGEYIRLRARIAKRNTWNKRGDMLFDLLKQDLAGAVE